MLRVSLSFMGRLLYSTVAEGFYLWEQIAFNVVSVTKLVPSGFRVVKKLINGSILGIMLYVCTCFHLGFVCPV